MATLYRPLLRRLGILLILLTCASLGSADHTRYRAIEISSMGGNIGYANSVNDADMVVGNAQYPDGHTQSFLWTPSAGIRRVQANVAASSALWINNKGQVAGSVGDSHGVVTAMVWDANLMGQAIAEAPFGAFAIAINDKGQAVGVREDGVFDPVQRAFLWPAIDPSSAWTDLFGTFFDSEATGINNRGAIVGTADSQAFLRRPDGKVIVLAGNPDSGPAAIATAINDSGNVLVSQGGRGFLLTSNKTIPIPGPGPVVPNALNLSDEVVGFVQTTSMKGFVWNQKDGFAELTGLVDTPGWQILSGNSINRYGHIAGYGIHFGRRRAVLLVPEKS